MVNERNVPNEEKTEKINEMRKTTTKQNDEQHIIEVTTIDDTYHRQRSKHKEERLSNHPYQNVFKIHLRFITIANPISNMVVIRCIHNIQTLRVYIHDINIVINTIIHYSIQ